MISAHFTFPHKKCPEVGPVDSADLLILDGDWYQLSVWLFPYIPPNLPRKTVAND
jgi:hypothetical protein